MTVVDIISLVVVISESLVEEESGQHATLLMIARKLIDCLKESVTSQEPLPPKAKPIPKPPSKEEKDEALNVVIGLIDQFCKEHLNEEYAVALPQDGREACPQAPFAFAQRKTEHLGQRDRPHRWLGELPLRQAPDAIHATCATSTHGFGISESSGAAKLAAIRKMLKITPLNYDWTLPSRMDKNPLIWMLQVNGMMMDIRHAPREAQEVAFSKGLIPYIPADRQRGE